MTSIVALIPARAGSKRVAGKNIRRLNGHPLIAYTIAAAAESGVFDAVIVSTDSEEYAEIARHYGAEVPFIRPAEFAGSLSPDIEWVEHAITALHDMGRNYSGFSILRPTSPFRQATTIQRAWKKFSGETGADSIRAVEPCKQHPGKMWVVGQRSMTPLLPFAPGGQPWHSSQYPALPEVYVQNASLEMAWSRVVHQGRTIAGDIVLPFFTEGYEGFDINDPEDWRNAEYLISENLAVLPPVQQEPY